MKAGFKKLLDAEKQNTYIQKLLKLQACFQKILVFHQMGVRMGLEEIDALIYIKILLEI